MSRPARRRPSICRPRRCKRSARCAFHSATTTTAVVAAAATISTVWSWPCMIRTPGYPPELSAVYVMPVMRRSQRSLRTALPLGDRRRPSLLELSYPDPTDVRDRLGPHSARLGLPAWVRQKQHPDLSGAPSPEGFSSTAAGGSTRSIERSCSFSARSRSSSSSSSRLSAESLNGGSPASLADVPNSADVRESEAGGRSR